MGLDMYLEGRKYIMEDWSNPANNETEEGFRVKQKVYELGYWRKHPNLHGYIVQQFANGEDKCQEIELGQEELIKLIEAIKNRELPHTTGFFFGQSDGSDEEAQEDLSIITRALIWLQVKDDRNYRSVVYRASW